MTPASYVAALLLLVPLSISCDRKAPPPEGDDGLAAPMTSAAAQADLTRREMIDYVHSLQAALRSNDRERFSKLLVYPIRVQTRHCTVVISGAGELLRHFDAIIAPTVQQVILNARHGRLAVCARDGSSGVSFAGARCDSGPTRLRRGHERVLPSSPVGAQGETRSASGARQPMRTDRRALRCRPRLCRAAGTGRATRNMLASR